MSKPRYVVLGFGAIAATGLVGLTLYKQPQKEVELARGYNALRKAAAEPTSGHIETDYNVPSIDNQVAQVHLSADYVYNSLCAKIGGYRQASTGLLKHATAETLAAHKLVAFTSEQDNKAINAEFKGNIESARGRMDDYGKCLSLKNVVVDGKFNGASTYFQRDFSISLAL